MIFYKGKLMRIILTILGLTAFSLSLAETLGNTIVVPHMPSEKSIVALNDAMMNKAANFKDQATASRQIATQKADNQDDKAKALADIGLDKYRQQLSVQQTVVPKLSGMMIFVSLSMPDQALKLINKQAAKLNIPVLLRGFYQDDFQKTLLRIASIIGVAQKGNKKQNNSMGGFSIDPERFAQFNIQSVPAFVLVNPERIQRGTQAISGDDFDVLVGNISVIDAISIFKQKSSASLQPIIQAMVVDHV